MKLAYKDYSNVIQLTVKNNNTKTIKYVCQLTLNLVALYIANKASIDIWRSWTGH